MHSDKNTYESKPNSIVAESGIAAESGMAAEICIATESGIVAEVRAREKDRDTHSYEKYSRESQR